MNSTVAGSVTYQLETVILPPLIRKVGDEKSGRLAAWMVENYIKDNKLVFDMRLIQAMFEEADYKKEGSLTAKDMVAILSGRYPKRRYTKIWRELVALLLGQESLNLEDEGTQQKGTQSRSSHRSRHSVKEGSFNSDSFWRDQPPPLPHVRDQRLKRRPVTSEWRYNTGGAASIAQSMAASSRAGGGDSGSLTTTWGPKSTSQGPAEATVNQELQGQVPRMTLAAANDFRQFQSRLELDPASTNLELGADNGLLLSDVTWHTGMDTVAVGPGSAGQLSGSGRAPPVGVRAWSAMLPPSAIHFPQSSLSTLRSSVRSTIASQPQFVTVSRRLDTHEFDLKKTLGKPMEMNAQAMNRVEPVRPTTVPLNASYIEACDYAPRCRTAPTRWHSEQTPPGKYPWSWPIPGMVKDE